MRLAFFLLVLLNLIFYVWSAGYLGGQDEGREPQRLQNQIQPEKIVVTPTTPAESAPAAAPPSVPAPVPAPPVPTPVPSAPGPTPAPPPSGANPASLAAPTVANAKQVSACRWIEGVAPKDAGALQQSVQKAGLVAAVLPMDERSFWVNIPALPNKAAADKKAGELKQLGVGDFHVMQGDAGSFVISLGVFGDEASASQFLQGLVKKGVRSARTDTRTKPATALRLELRGPSDLLAQRLPQLLTSAPGSRAAACP